MNGDEAILQGLPDALFSLREGRVVWANAAAERLTGAPVVGRPLAALLAEGEGARVERWLRRPEPGRGGLLVRFRSGDGSTVPTEMTVAESGEPLVVCARDVSPVDRAVGLMRRLGRVVSDAERFADPDALIAEAEAVILALGWRAALLRRVEGGVEVRRTIGLGQTRNPVYDFAKDLRDRGVVPLEEMPLAGRVFETGEPLLVRDPIRQGVDGRAATFIGAMVRAGYRGGAWFPVGAGSEVDHVLVVVGADLSEMDLAALHLFAAQLAASLRLARLRETLLKRERLAALGEMAGVVAHEVRNPLGVLFNVVSGLRRRLSDPEALVPLSAVEEAADRLRRLVNGLVELARVRSPELRAVPLAPLVEESVDGLGPWRDGRPEVRLPEELPAARTDPNLLRLALAALLENAREHGVPGGPVVVTGRRSGAEVCLDVDNDCSTLPEEVAARMFDPMYTTKPEGAGFGLPVAQRILEELGGRLSYAPRPGGARFSMCLPMSNEEEEG